MLAKDMKSISDLADATRRLEGEKENSRRRRRRRQILASMSR